MEENNTYQQINREPQAQKSVNQKNIEQSLTPPKNVWFNFNKLQLILILTVIFAAISVLSGYIYQKNRQLKNKLSQANTQEISSLSTPTPDLYREPGGSAATADWKVYVSELGIYQFKYPPYLNSLTKIKTEDRLGEVEKFKLTNQNQDFMSILITVFKDSPVYGITKEEYVESFRKDAQVSGTDSPSMIWGGAKNVAISESISGIEFGYGGVDSVLQIVFDHSGYLIVFSPSTMGMDLQESQEFIKTTYQILSTLQFTD